MLGCVQNAGYWRLEVQSSKCPSWETGQRGVVAMTTPHPCETHIQRQRHVHTANKARDARPIP
jgi:hypothetical protein